MDTSIKPEPRQSASGRIVVSPYATTLFQRIGYGTLDTLLAAHAHAEWGAVTQETAQANDRALIRGCGPIVSIQMLDDGTSVLFETNSDWSQTAVALSEDVLESIYSLGG